MCQESEGVHGIVTTRELVTLTHYSRLQFTRYSVTTLTQPAYSMSTPTHSCKDRVLVLWGNHRTHAHVGNSTCTKTFLHAIVCQPTDQRSWNNATYALIIATYTQENLEYRDILQGKDANSLENFYIDLKKAPFRVDTAIQFFRIREKYPYFHYKKQQSHCQEDTVKSSLVEIFNENVLDVVDHIMYSWRECSDKPVQCTIGRVCVLVHSLTLAINERAT
ncbi:hypothetical protein CBL_01379 [Carabus blaptoides fortunei]